MQISVLHYYKNVNGVNISSSKHCSTTMFHACFKIILIFSLGFWREKRFQTFEERLDLLSLVSFLDWVVALSLCSLQGSSISHTVSANHQNAVHIPEFDQGSCAVVTSAIRAITGFAESLDVVSCSLAELLITNHMTLFILCFGPASSYLPSYLPSHFQSFICGHWLKNFA